MHRPRDALWRPGGGPSSRLRPVSLGSPPPRGPAPCLLPVYSLWKPRPRLTGPPPASPASALPGVACMDSGCGGHRCTEGQAPPTQPRAAPCLEWGGGNASPREPPPPPPSTCLPTVQAQGPGPHCRQELGQVEGAGLWGGQPPTAERLVPSQENPAGRGGADPGLQARPGFNTGANQTGMRPGTAAEQRGEDPGSERGSGQSHPQRVVSLT